MNTTKRHPVRSIVILLVAVLVGVIALVVGHVTSDASGKDSAHAVSYTPKLALDLEGGTELILKPTMTGGIQKEITEKDISEAINIIRSRVDASGVAESEIAAMGTDNISVALPGHPSEETLDLIRSSSQMDFRPVIEAGQARVPAQARMNIPQSGGAQQSGAIQQSGVAQKPAAAQQSGVGQKPAAAQQSGIAAQSGASDKQAVSKQSGADTPQSFKSSALTKEEALKALKVDSEDKLSDKPDKTPKDHSDPAWATQRTIFDYLTLDCSSSDSKLKGAVSDTNKAYVSCSTEGNEKYILGPVDVKGSDLSSATSSPVYNHQGHSTGQWGVNIEFNAEGAPIFTKVSERLFQLGKQGNPNAGRFAVVLDGNVISAPSMNTVITDGHAQITGNFTPESSKALANKLSFGSLPLNFDVQSEQQISATLGSDHLEKGIWAGIIGLILVAIYLLWNYQALAIISIGSLLAAAGVTYLVITLLSWWIGYRLSLPGVAGLIVAVGITADSFIVYFERIRDEVRDGRPLSTAVEEGWDRAKRTILVSDAVNLLAAVVLYFLAVGGVQGFAFTLGVTTVVDLIIIFLFTHPLMEILIKIPFFAEGHKHSGLDPEHLGAKSGLVYAGRGSVKVINGKQSRKEKAVSSDAQSLTSSSSEGGTSIAERRRQQQEAERSQENNNQLKDETPSTVATATGEDHS